MITIVYVLDSLRLDHVGAENEGLKVTPNIDILVGEGCIVCDSHFAEATWTLPSIASILTGMHPLELNIRYEDDRLLSKPKILPEYYKETGYKTFAVSANPYFDKAFNLDRGFDEFISLLTFSEFNKRNRDTIPTSRDINKKILEIIDQNKGKELFIMAFSLDTHNPYYPREIRFNKFIEDIGDVFLTLKEIHKFEDEKDYDVVRALYRNMVAFNDKTIGELVESLKERGLFDATTLLITSDHGESLSKENFGHNVAPLKEVVHLPLIIKPPKGIKPQRIKHLTSLVNVLPTLLDLDLGIKDESLKTVFDEYRSHVYSTREGRKGNKTYDSIIEKDRQYIWTQKTDAGFINELREAFAKLRGKGTEEPDLNCIIKDGKPQEKITPEMIENLKRLRPMVHETTGISKIVSDIEGI